MPGYHKKSKKKKIKRSSRKKGLVSYG
jgi:hypothetical protein